MEEVSDLFLSLVCHNVCTCMHASKQAHYMLCIALASSNVCGIGRQNKNVCKGWDFSVQMFVLKKIMFIYKRTCRDTGTHKRTHNMHMYTCTQNIFHVQAWRPLVFWSINAENRKDKISLFRNIFALKCDALYMLREIHTFLVLLWPYRRQFMKCPDG